MIRKKEEVSKRYTEWHQYLDNSKLSPSGILPSTSTHLLIHPKWLHQLYTKNSNLWAFGGHSYPDHTGPYYPWQGSALAYSFHLKVMSRHICHHSMPGVSAVGRLVGCPFVGALSLILSWRLHLVREVTEVHPTCHSQSSSSNLGLDNLLRTTGN